MSRHSTPPVLSSPPGEHNPGPFRPDHERARSTRSAGSVFTSPQTGFQRAVHAQTLRQCAGINTLNPDNPVFTEPTAQIHAGTPVTGTRAVFLDDEPIDPRAGWTRHPRHSHRSSPIRGYVMVTIWRAYEGSVQDFLISCHRGIENHFSDAGFPKRRTNDLRRQCRPRERGKPFQSSA